TGWYLPAIQELELLLLNYNVHKAVDYQMTFKGGTLLYSIGANGYACYWSSTEDNFQQSDGTYCARYVYVGSGGSVLPSKNDSKVVRAVSAF
ncbi:MAG: hypothetical protein IJ990_08860, partial [Alistipes sp.]|nr:hypothetical protein [Alistipes sp.]